MKSIAVMMVTSTLLVSCEKALFEQQIEPENAKTGEPIELKSKVTADNYEWNVEQYTYDPQGSTPPVFETYYEVNPIVQWDYPGSYRVHLTTVKNGQKRSYSGYVYVN